MFSGPNLNDVNWPIKVGLEKTKQLRQDWVNFHRREYPRVLFLKYRRCKSPFTNFKAMKNNFSTKGQMTMESVRAKNTRNFGRLLLVSETQPRNYIPVDEAECNSMFQTSLRE